MGWPGWGLLGVAKTRFCCMIIFRPSLYQVGQVTPRSTLDKTVRLRAVSPNSNNQVRCFMFWCGVSISDGGLDIFAQGGPFGLRCSGASPVQPQLHTAHRPTKLIHARPFPTYEAMC